MEKKKKFSSESVKCISYALEQFVKGNRVVLLSDLDALRHSPVSIRKVDSWKYVLETAKDIQIKWIVGETECGLYGITWTGTTEEASESLIKLRSEFAHVFRKEEESEIIKLAQENLEKRSTAATESAVEETKTKTMDKRHMQNRQLLKMINLLGRLKMFNEVNLKDFGTDHVSISTLTKAAEKEGFFLKWEITKRSKASSVKFLRWTGEKEELESVLNRAITLRNEWYGESYEDDVVPKATESVTKEQPVVEEAPEVKVKEMPKVAEPEPIKIEEHQILSLFAKNQWKEMSFGQIAKGLGIDKRQLQVYFSKDSNKVNFKVTYSGPEEKVVVTKPTCTVWAELTKTLAEELTLDLKEEHEVIKDVKSVYRINYRFENELLIPYLRMREELGERFYDNGLTEYLESLKRKLNPIVLSL